MLESSKSESICGGKKSAKWKKREAQRSRGFWDNFRRFFVQHKFIIQLMKIETAPID